MSTEYKYQPRRRRSHNANNNSHSGSTRLIATGKTTITTTTPLSALSSSSSGSSTCSKPPASAQTPQSSPGSEREAPLTPPTTPLQQLQQHMQHQCQQQQQQHHQHPISPLALEQHRLRPNNGLVHPYADHQSQQRIPTASETLQYWAATSSAQGRRFLHPSPTSGDHGSSTPSPLSSPLGGPTSGSNLAEHYHENNLASGEDLSLEDQQSLRSGYNLHHHHSHHHQAYFGGYYSEGAPSYHGVSPHQHVHQYHQNQMPLTPNGLNLTDQSHQNWPL